MGRHVQEVVRADGDDAGPPLLHSHHQGVLLPSLALGLRGSMRHQGALGGLEGGPGATQGGVTPVQLLHPHVGHPDIILFRYHCRASHFFLPSLMFLFSDGFLAVDFVKNVVC